MVVSHLSVLSMSVVGSPPKKVWIDRWVDGVRSIQFLFECLEFINFCRVPLEAETRVVHAKLRDFAHTWSWMSLLQ